MQAPEKNYKILLVEDDEDDYYFFNMMLSSLPGHYDMLRISNGIMLSSIIQTSHIPDVIFLDINMPYKSGIDCIKEIRSNTAWDSVKVVMYSTSCNSVDITRCYNNGANFYIIKPASRLIGIEQLNWLFENEYLYNNIKTPKEDFVILLNETVNPLVSRFLAA